MITKTNFSEWIKFLIFLSIYQWEMVKYCENNTKIMFLEFQIQAFSKIISLLFLCFHQNLFLKIHHFFLGSFQDFQVLLCMSLFYVIHALCEKKIIIIQFLKNLTEVKIINTCIFEINFKLQNIIPWFFDNLILGRKCSLKPYLFILKVSPLLMKS